MSSPSRIPVLYDDDYYMAFEKPPGLLVIPSPKKEKYTLLNLVNKEFASPTREGRLHPCHRLDRDTSGVILFAKGKKNQKAMMEEFKKRRVRKTYIAFVQGRLKNSAGEIRDRIRDPFKARPDAFLQNARVGARFHKRAPLQWAITRYRVLETKKDFSILEVCPITGRTNQIRIHLSRMGHPVVGERQYAFGRDYPVKFRRTALHASSLRWMHPVYKREIRIHSPLPEDMKKFLERN